MRWRWEHWCFSSSNIERFFDFFWFGRFWDINLFRDFSSVTLMFENSFYFLVWNVWKADQVSKFFSGLRSIYDWFIWDLFHVLLFGLLKVLVFLVFFLLNSLFMKSSDFIIILFLFWNELFCDIFLLIPLLLFLFEKFICFFVKPWFSSFWLRSLCYWLKNFWK